MWFHGSRDIALTIWYDEIMRYILLLAFMIVSLCAAAQAFARESVVLVTDEYMPYVNTTKEDRGVLTEIVVAAFDEVGVDVEIRFRPWRRCSLLVETGQVFGAYPYARTERRSRFAFFTDEIWQFRNVFFYHRGRFPGYDFTSLDAMKGVRIAGTSGNYYEEVFEEAGLTVDYAPGEASGLRKVWEMRADLFAEAELVGWTLIQRIFPQHMNMFGSTPTPWNIKSQSIMVSRRYPGAQRLLHRFNQGLRRIRENGVYERLVERFMPPRPSW